MKLPTFKQYLNEEFTIKDDIVFGTDYKDMQFKKQYLGESGLIFTYFYFEEYKVKILYYDDNGSLSFAVMNPDNQWKLRPSKSEVHFKNMQAFYSTILSIVLKMIEKYKLDIIDFTAAEDRLDKTYGLILRSSSLKSIMKLKGFISSFKKEDGKTHYIFKKVSDVNI